MWRTEVTFDAQTWVFITERICGDEYETTVTEPGATIAKRVRRCHTAQRAREVHRVFVDEFAATGYGAVVVNR
ncbi:hypothetical protein QFW96_13135 [Saccharopolyspora sp. TS4A08]|uniref:DUF2188 domain-containing protein n=1 Tax=Saccharopolyspora ipomoeae TaxID=3042027 RepID=A0ABT6PNH1_9PSEU|nr:hypothetical protein [Saccharopolyspora sp. TS4A08]MDI2029567.1 hypothetical protein [Saccharopolyspora sp. TS4A08]